MKKVTACILMLFMFICVSAMSESIIIQKGDTGGTVLAIQKILSSLNYLSEEYVTGEYEDMTELAVLAFQLDHGISPTGIADIETQQAITGTLKDANASDQGHDDEVTSQDDVNGENNTNGQSVDEGSNNGDDTTPLTGTESDNMAESQEREQEDEAVSDNEKEKTLINNQDVSITVRSIESEKDSLEMKLVLENKTDKVAMFTVTHAIINGWKADPFWADTVPAGKKANEKLSWSKLSEKGITSKPSVIILGLRVYDNDNWSAPDILNQEFVVYPDGKDSVQIDEYQIKDSDVVLVDNDDISIVVTGYGTDWMGSYIANVYLRNRTEKTLMFSTEDASINGYACDPFWATELTPNSQTMSDISWYKSTLEENDIDEVKEIEMKFRVYDSNDWSAPNVLEDMYILNP